MGNSVPETCWTSTTSLLAVTGAPGTRRVAAAAVVDLQSQEPGLRAPTSRGRAEPNVQADG